MLPEKIYLSSGYKKLNVNNEILNAYINPIEKNILVEVDYHDTTRINARLLKKISVDLVAHINDISEDNFAVIYVIDTYSSVIAQDLMDEESNYLVYDTHKNCVINNCKDKDKYKKIYKKIYNFINDIEEPFDRVMATVTQIIGNTKKINSLIVLINVLVFIWMAVIGDSANGVFRLEHGWLYWPNVVKFGEWYRIFSSLFIHSNLSHLCSNMIVLFFVGMTLEKIVGKRKYLAIYMISGVGANIISSLYYQYTMHSVMICGASGAIFGVVGGLAYIVIVNRGKFEGLSIQRIMLFVIMSIYTALEETNISIVAHISGLIVGFITTMMLYKNKNAGMEAI